ncbi:hypothetical protein F4779DRAFT_70637 [Xylariaceae sp. FL0662B]|nr:hypothetical protein F4779DRAFT_70637 [Xylariaceae sp. FL0662B]
MYGGIRGSYQITRSCPFVTLVFLAFVWYLECTQTSMTALPPAGENSVPMSASILIRSIHPYIWSSGTRSSTRQIVIGEMASGMNSRMVGKHASECGRRVFSLTRQFAWVLT